MCKAMFTKVRQLAQEQLVLLERVLQELEQLVHLLVGRQ